MSKAKDYEISSGNVFQDLGLPNAEAELLKAKLSLQIFRLIKKRGLTQEQAAKLLGVRQPEISKLKNGKFSRFRVERLFHFLNRLDRKITIKITKAKKGETPNAVCAL